MSLARDICDVELQLRGRPDVNLFAPDIDASAIPECNTLIAAIARRGTPDAASMVRLCLQSLRIQYEEFRPSMLDAELVATLPEGTPGLARTTTSVVREMIERARAEIVLLGYELTDKELVRQLAAARSRGAEVILICDRAKAAGKRVLGAWPREIPRPQVFQDRLRADAAPYASMHAKSIVVDSADLLVTSANFTFHGLQGNIEIGIRLSGAPAAEARKIFSHLVEGGIVELCR